MDDAFALAGAFFIQLFVIVDPVAGVPVFLAITPNNSRQQRLAMAWRGCWVAFVVIAFFLLAGPRLLAYFGIGTEAVQICGGVLLFVIGLEMLYGRATGTGTTPREERLAEAKADISITPLAIPLLAGPGAIATCLLFAKKAPDLPTLATLLLAAAGVFAVTFLFLRRADDLVRWIGSLGTVIVTRLMGLMVTFIAVQYFIDGVRTVLGR